LERKNHILIGQTYISIEMRGSNLASQNEVGIGIGAAFQVLQAFEPRWQSYTDGIIALAVSLVITVALSVIDLRSRFRY
jgi:hypothetical protein